MLWKLIPDESIAPVVVRVFGLQTDKLIDRSREQDILLQLNKAGFGAQVLAAFDNGRIEEFLNMRTLEPKDMTARPMAARIARRLKQFHAVDIAGPREPQSFRSIRKWIAMGRDLDFSDDARKQEAYEQVDFDRMEHECRQTEAACLRMDSPVVFNHDDMLAGNVLVPHDDSDASTMQFIDFEYARWSHRGFDLGNHFNEYAGFECDYTRYPEKEHIAFFMQHYLAEGEANEPEEAQVQKAVIEANVFALASHQFWGSWALLQAKFSPIEFDYMEYSNLRWSEYLRRKEEFLADVDNFCSKHC